jgi:hypothetical protein
MPHYCGNQLYITGPKDLRTHVINDVILSKNQLFSLHKIKPETSLNHGFTWRVHPSNWGVSEDCRDVIREHNDTHTTYIFRTHGAPFSQTIFKILCDKYPLLHFKLRFLEALVGFYGYYDSGGATYVKYFEIFSYKHPFKNIDRSELIDTELSEYQICYAMSKAN